MKPGGRKGAVYIHREGKSAAMLGPICRRKFTAPKEVDDDITLGNRRAGRVPRPRSSSVRCTRVPGDPGTPPLGQASLRRLARSINSLKVNKIRPCVAGVPGRVLA